ncbi:MAG: serine/threonine protein kinase [Phycisphaerales bacterium]|nr:serine/threonine protein kinase [Phycisphaerales bacterium]
MAYTFKYGDRPLDGITIQRAVGRGGFGEVYYALTDAGKQIALKYLRENADVELRGIANVLNLKSPHLMPIHDVRKNAGGEWFVILEYVSGPSLRDLLIAEPNGLGVHKTAFFVNGIAKGLSYLHERGIVHRDLKPGNIFYDDGYVKIGDYGLSKYIPVSHHSGQTMSVGTVHYMAPEIGSGQYTKAIDVYALGVITYEMLTGKLPFAGSSMAEILMRHLTERPDLTRVPEPFATVIARAMQKDPKERYQDVNEMVDALMASTAFTEGLSNFDPSSIRQVPRSPDAVDPERTMTTPPRPIPPPPLDARAMRDLRSPAPMNPGARPVAEVERLSRKLQEKLTSWEKRLAKRGVAPHPRNLETVARASRLDQPARGRKFVSMLQLFGICAAVSAVLALMMGANDGEEIIGFMATSMMFVVGATFSLMVTHMLLLPRLVFRAGILDRLTYAVVGALCLLPGMVVAGEYHRHMPEIGFGFIAMMFLCDWNARMIAGRYRQFSGSDAVGPFLVALVVAGIADADRFSLAAGAIAAMIAMVAPAVASLWPPRVDTPVDGPRGAGDDPFVQIPEDRTVVAKVDVAAALNTAVHETGQAVKTAMEHVKSALQPPPVPSAPTTPAIPVPPRMMTARSRSASALIGGLLIFAGLFGAFGFALESERVHRLPQALSRIEHPRPIVMALVALGGILLLFGRRREGFMHVSRGLIGVGLAAATAGIVMSSRSGVLVQKIVDGEMGYVIQNFDRALPFAVPLGIALMFLMWPSAAQRRQRTIVI